MSPRQQQSCESASFGRKYMWPLWFPAPTSGPCFAAQLVRLKLQGGQLNPCQASRCLLYCLTMVSSNRQGCLGPLEITGCPPDWGPKMAGLCYSPPPEGEPESLVLAFMAITVASPPGTSCSKKPYGHGSLPKPAELPRLPASPRVPFFSCGVLSVPFTQQHRPQAGAQARPESLPGEERSPQPLMCTEASPPHLLGTD